MADEQSNQPLDVERLTINTPEERRAQRQHEQQEALRQGILLGTNATERWGSLAEKRIHDAIEAGAFNKLKGEGAPLPPSEYDNPLCPDDQKMAFSLLRNNGVVPDWVQLAQEIERDREAATSFAGDHFAMLRQRLANLSRLPILKMRNEVDSLKRSHAAATTNYRTRLVNLNEKINRFNAICPVASLSQATCVLDTQLRDWDRRTPAYLEY